MRKVSVRLLCGVMFVAIAVLVKVRERGLDEARQEGTVHEDVAGRAH